jgi:hypothetical protein
MDKLVTLIVLVLVVVIVITALSGWRSDYEPPISRFPTSARNGNLEHENFISQTVPTAIFELYRSAVEAFEPYGLQIGYKFKGEVTAWEFYVSGANIDFDAWMECYREMFPYGHDFTLPPLKPTQDIYGISMNITEDTYSHEYVEKLNVYLNEHGKPKYEYALKPNGVFEFNSDDFYHIKSSSKQTVEKGDKAVSVLNIKKWITDKGWDGSSYGFFVKGKHIGLCIISPNVFTVKSYFELLHPNFSSAREGMLKTVQEITVYFEDDITDLTIVSDEFYIGV